ncbi:MAG: rRNA methyltransferase [Xanthomonadales bacterium]|nr:rRNA methyltransferase [Xanthomonadales bacterium]
MTALSWWIAETTGSPEDEALAREHRLPVQRTPPTTGWYLARDNARLALHRADGPRAYPLICDLAAVAAERAAGARQSPLAKACGLARPTTMRVCDATAGLGRDSVMLAWLGAMVTPLERHPAIYLLLHDAWQHVHSSPAPPAWAARLEPPQAVDAARWFIEQPPATFDTIYMDPMFAATRRKAQPQKALAWLGELAGPDMDADDLLAAAHQAAAKRVVVKQHARSTPLASPSYQIKAKAVRFDVYLIGNSP